MLVRGRKELEVIMESGKVPISDRVGWSVPELPGAPL